MSFLKPDTPDAPIIPLKPTETAPKIEKAAGRKRKKPGRGALMVTKVAKPTRQTTQSYA